MSETTALPNIYDFTLEPLESQLVDWGEARYRARQIWQGLYHHLVDDPADIKGLPGSLKARLAEAFNFRNLQTLDIRQSASGETAKYAFRIAGGGAIETVLMKYDRRRTACISSQAGCALGCVFCATGQMGLQRNLTAGEIIEQVLILARRLKSEGSRLTNVVVMGMGEPFHNYDATLAAIDTLNHPEGFNFGARRFTISTVGLVPMIQKFTAEKRQVNLAVSLHAATNALRDQLMPVNRRYPLETLIPACRDYVRETGRRITFEWALIRGVNDGLDQAAALADLLHGLNCHVNLIPLNETRGYPYQPADEETVKVFQRRLEEAGISCTIRLRRGVEIDAGCGQLATKVGT